MPRTLALVALTIALLLATTASASAHHYDSLLAPTSVCPGQSDTRRSVDDQEWTMRCMHNYVRSKRRLPYLSTRSRLMSAAGSKSADIMRCQDFAHQACGPRHLLLDTAQRVREPLLGRRREHRLGLGVARVGPGDHERVAALHPPPPEPVQVGVSRQGHRARQGYVPGLSGLPGVQFGYRC